MCQSEYRVPVTTKILSAKLKKIELPAPQLVVSGVKVKFESNLITIDEALEAYLSVKGRGKSERFFSHT